MAFFCHTPLNLARRCPPWNTFQKCIQPLGPEAMRDAASLLYARVFINTTWFTVPSPSTIAKNNTSYIAPYTLKLSDETVVCIE